MLAGLARLAGVLTDFRSSLVVAESGWMPAKLANSANPFLVAVSMLAESEATPAKLAKFANPLWAFGPMLAGLAGLAGDPSGFGFSARWERRALIRASAAAAS